MSGIDYTIDNRSLSERVADKIELLIKEENIQPGEKILNEYELANKLEVGRSTVREAVKLLVSKNILEIRRGSGTFVCTDLGIVDDPLGFRFETDKKKLALDLAKIRLLIEPQMAYDAARLATDEDVEELTKLNKEIDLLIDKGVDYSQPDTAFHTKICSITGNCVMPKLIPIITSGIEYYTQVTNANALNNTSMGHQHLIESLQNHDSQKAFNTMYEHINSGIISMNEL